MAKRLLVESLDGLLPDPIVRRPKQRFTLPFDPWMRGPLKSFCEERLGERGLSGRGMFNPLAASSALAVVSRRAEATCPGRVSGHSSSSTPGSIGTNWPWHDDVSNDSVVNLSVVVLTFNEERNLAALPRKRRRLGRGPVRCRFRQHGPDGGASRRHSAPRSLTHPFESHARQWHWALRTPARFERVWMLAIDADQSLTPELQADIANKLHVGNATGGPAGAYLNRRQIFRGRWIKHGGYYPKYLLKLFRRDAVSLDETTWSIITSSSRGPTVTLDGDLIEDNRNEAEIAVWIGKHNRYAVLQAREEASRTPPVVRPTVHSARPMSARGGANRSGIGCRCMCGRSDISSIATSSGWDFSTARKASSSTSCRRSGTGCSSTSIATRSGGRRPVRTNVSPTPTTRPAARGETTVTAGRFCTH